MVISFLEAQMEHVTCPREDALVITAKIDSYDVKRVLKDSGNSTDILILEALKKIKRLIGDLKKVTIPLMGFASNNTYLV